MARQHVVLPSGQTLIDQALVRLVDRRYRARRWCYYAPPPTRVVEDKVTGLVVATAGDYARARELLSRALAKAR
jgi:hypothetical protein